MALIPNSSVVPPGGFHFLDHSSGQETRIDGSSEDDVARNVLKYRLANSLPPGEPLEEYRAQLCGQHPHFCHNTESPVNQSTYQGGEHISRRVSTWMSDFIRGYRAEPVGAGEADRRAAICAACPMNVQYNATGCGACLENIERLSFISKANKTTQYDSVLMGCNAIGQHNGTAVWASAMPPVKPGTELPAQCWRR